MTMRRTDLALEARELWQESAGETTKLPGVEARDGEREGLPVTTVDILDQEGEKALGKPKGRYVTLTLESSAARACIERAKMSPSRLANPSRVRVT